MQQAPILVIDDSPTLLKLVQLALAETGHRVETASDARSAIEAARQHRPALILLDDVLPDMSARALCQSLRDETGGVPILVMRSGTEDGDGLGESAGVADAISKPFTPDALRAVVAHVLEGGSPSATARLALTPAEGVHVSEDVVPDLDGLALAGDLAMIPLSDVLALLRDGQHSGRLAVSRDRARIHVFVKFGALHFATSAEFPEEFLLGRFLVERGHLSRADLDEALGRKRKAKDSRVLGAVLVEQYRLAPDKLADAVSAQTTAIVHEAMRWSHGRFAFDTQCHWPANALQADVSLSIDRVVMEGLRKVSEWRVIERVITDFDEVLVREDARFEALGRGQLLADEIEIANLVNGKNAIKDIITLSGKGSFDVSRILFRLLRSKLVRRRVAPAIL